MEPKTVEINIENALELYKFINTSKILKKFMQCKQKVARNKRDPLKIGDYLNNLREFLKSQEDEAHNFRDQHLRVNNLLNYKKKQGKGNVNFARSSNNADSGIQRKMSIDKTQKIG